MQEIDLTKTPLSEIDLNKIDYEKSYVISWGDTYYVKKISYDKVDMIWHIYDSESVDLHYGFSNNGQHIYCPRSCTLHLFYKEEKSCNDCQYNYDINGISVVLEKCISCCNNDLWKPKDKHPIIIEYQDLGDKVKILKIEGVMTFEEIEKHAGFHVLNQYASGCCMRMENSDDFTIRCIDGVIRFYKPSVNKGISKQEFDYLIESMKLSAKRLAELIKESKKPVVRRIEI
jgi:hypothetical protein